MSLHGLTGQTWKRHNARGSWDYRIVAPGYKYNLTDIAASLGLHQLARAEQMRCEREAVADFYRGALGDLAQLRLPSAPRDRIHAWHLFAVQLCLSQFNVGRDKFIDLLRQHGVGCSVHWRPLHLHPYYRKKFGWQPEDFPRATSVWRRLVSLPLFPGMQQVEQQYVVDTVRDLCLRLAR
jgi:perosamine synthetase